MTGHNTDFLTSKLILLSIVLICTCFQIVSADLNPPIPVSPSYRNSVISLRAGGNSIRLRSNPLRRAEQCKESLPRKSTDLPSLVIVGRVKEVYSPFTTTFTTKVSILSSTENSTTITTNQTESLSLKAVVNIIRVIKGNQQLEDDDIIVSGINSTASQPCPNYVKDNDTLILLLDFDQQDRSYKIHNGNLLAMNLNNLDKINAIATDEPFKRRGPIEDILCEAHYCPYGRCKIFDSGVTCECPTNCEPKSSPVCGSDNATYSNECELIQEGCRRQRPMFVTKETAC